MVCIHHLIQLLIQIIDFCSLTRIQHKKIILSLLLEGRLLYLQLILIQMNKVISSTQKWIEKDRRIWVTAKPIYSNPSQDAFLQAKVQQIRPKEIIIVLKKNGQKQAVYDDKRYAATYEQCQKLTYGPSDVSDMVDLQELNQPELLFNLKRRYLADSIFTYCGPTLVIINPYAYLNHLIKDQVLLQYQSYVFLESFQYKTLPPHIFGLAAFCLWQLFQNSRNQSIVISGQSGAGKTQNTKYCLKYLASLGKNLPLILKDKKLSKIISAKTMSFIKKDTKLFGIQDKILGCNQILQAFGNAKTIRNDNSSRFGKLILLLYGQSQFDIKSAFIISYLLQKSRIVSVCQGERNYHIFYYFLKGLNPEKKKLFMVNNKMDQYKYLNQSTIYSIKGISDEKKFIEVQRDFANYLIQQEIHCIFKLLSIILNLGNLEFKRQQSKNNEEMAVPTNPQYLKVIAQLLCVDYDTFVHSFQYKSRKMGQNIINSPLKYDEAVALQNSFAKNLYQKIFIFIVGKLNEKIQLQKINLDQTDKSFRKSIGILDIFGFEVLGINSLQQFFINFANQKLQQLYVSYVFKEQQNEFIKEGLQEFSLQIDFQDNKPVIDLFELYPLGLFHLINQSSQLNKPDENLPESIMKNHSKNQFLQIPKGKRGIFLINHSCSPVNYSTSGFTNRNKDEFPQQLLDVIMNSTDETLKKMVGGDGKSVQVKGRNAAKKFLGSKFLNQMNKLTDQLYSSDCHFVRCIKPNSLKAPKMFNSTAVLQSLRYLGVLDSILIRKLGYIYRRSFKQFLKKFFQIQQYIYRYPAFIKDKNEEYFKQYARKFVEKYAPKELNNRFILFGHNKIFIKESALNILQVIAKQKRKLRIQSANKIKRMYLTSVFRSRVKVFLKSLKTLKVNMQYLASKVKQTILKKKCIKIQQKVRQFLMQKRMLKIKQQAEKSVRKIAAYYRMKKCRMTFLKIKQKLIKVQAHIRFFVSMSHYLKIKNCKESLMQIFMKSWNIIEHRNAVKIQAFWKGYQTRKRYKAILENIRKRLRLKKYQQYFMKLISENKYKKFVQKLNRYKKPIVKMQAVVRGKLCFRTYILMKNCAILIQKTFRGYLRKKYFLIKKWKDYRRYILYDQHLKIKELSQLGIPIKNIDKIKYYPQTVGGKLKLYPQQILNKYLKKQESHLNQFINETIQFKNKNTFQTYIGDYDVLSNHHYKGKWLQHYCKTKEQMYRKNQYPIFVSFNQSFTSLLSNKDKIYNFYSDQNEGPNKVQVGGIVQSFNLCNHGAYLLKNDKKLYMWGTNYFGFFEKIDQIVMQCKQVIQLNKIGISDIACNDNKRYFVSHSNKVYHYTQHTQTCQGKMQILQVGNNICITSISSSINFALFLNSNGQVYAQGINKRGELGLGFTSSQVSHPQMISQFFKNKQIIETISTGMSHCVAKSKLGYVYTWGSNNFNQVTNKNIEFLNAPEVLQTQQGKIKALQAVAGLRTTFILTQNQKLIGIGTSSSFLTQKHAFNYQLQMLKQTTNNKQLVQVKISTKWARQMSILFINAIDSSRCKEGTKLDVILKYTKMISKQWPQNKIYPVYHEWMQNVLQLGDMKKFKFQSLANSQVKVNIPKEKLKSPKEELDELKALMNLRKSSIFFKKEASQKMEQALDKLKSRQATQWSQSQRQLFEYISEKRKLFK